MTSRREGGGGEYTKPRTTKSCSIHFLQYLNLAELMSPRDCEHEAFVRVLCVCGFFVLFTWPCSATLPVPGAGLPRGRTRARHRPPGAAPPPHRARPPPPPPPPVPRPTANTIVRSRIRSGPDRVRRPSSACRQRLPSGNAGEACRRPRHGRAVLIRAARITRAFQPPQLLLRLPVRAS